MVPSHRTCHILKVKEFTEICFLLKKKKKNLFYFLYSRLFKRPLCIIQPHLEALRWNQCLLKAFKVTELGFAVFTKRSDWSTNFMATNVPTIHNPASLKLQINFCCQRWWRTFGVIGSIDVEAFWRKQEENKNEQDVRKNKVGGIHFMKNLTFTTCVWE